MLAVSSKVKSKYLYYATTRVRLITKHWSLTMLTRAFVNNTGFSKQAMESGKWFQSEAVRGKMPETKC